MTMLPEATNWRTDPRYALAQRMHQESMDATHDALLNLYGTMPMNRPYKYIDLEEISRRIGIKHESMTTNIKRSKWFPFTPAVTVSGKKHWYYRELVEPWIAEKQFWKERRNAD